MKFIEFNFSREELLEFIDIQLKNLDVSLTLFGFIPEFNDKVCEVCDKYRSLRLLVEHSSLLDDIAEG